MRRMAAVWAVALVGCAGCAQRTGYLGYVRAVEGGAEAVVVGDWADVDAAVRWGVGKAEVAVVEREEGEGVVRYGLVTVDGRPGELEVERDGEGIRLRCRLGRFGDARGERRVVEAVAGRLRSLYGVEWRRGG